MDFCKYENKEFSIEETNPDWKDLFYEIGGSDEMLQPDFKIGDYNEK